MLRLHHSNVKPRRSRKLTLLWIVLSLLVAAVGVWGFLVLRDRPYKQMKRAIHIIDEGINSYVNSHDGNLPRTLEEVIAEERMRLPDNPFGKGKIKVLKASDPWESGAVVYIGIGAYAGFAKSREEAHQIARSKTPKEINEALLLAYGPDTGRDSADLRENTYDTITSEDDILSEAERMIMPLTEPGAIDAIAWDHVIFIAEPWHVGQESEIWDAYKYRWYRLLEILHIGC